jgi:signal transduction protein with GAF and PtsI domain
MFPMVADGRVPPARSAVDRELSHLAPAAIACRNSIRLGVMIEVPALLFSSRS